MKIKCKDFNTWMKLLCSRCLPEACNPWTPINAAFALKLHFTAATFSLFVVFLHSVLYLKHPLLS